MEAGREFASGSTQRARGLQMMQKINFDAESEFFACEFAGFPGGFGVVRVQQARLGWVGGWVGGWVEHGWDESGFWFQVEVRAW